MKSTIGLVVCLCLAAGLLVAGYVNNDSGSCSNGNGDHLSVGAQASACGKATAGKSCDPAGGECPGCPADSTCGSAANETTCSLKTAGNGNGNGNGKEAPCCGAGAIELCADCCKKNCPETSCLLVSADKCSLCSAQSPCTLNSNGNGNGNVYSTVEAVPTCDLNAISSCSSTGAGCSVAALETSGNGNGNGESGCSVQTQSCSKAGNGNGDSAPACCPSQASGNGNGNGESGCSVEKQSCSKAGNGNGDSAPACCPSQASGNGNGDSTSGCSKSTGNGNGNGESGCSVEKQSCSKAGNGNGESGCSVEK